MNSAIILNSVIILFRALSLIVWYFITYVAVVHILKCIFKKRDIDVISEIVIIIVGITAIVWLVPLS